MSAPLTDQPVLSGHSLVAGEVFIEHGEAFHGYNPSDGSTLEPIFFSATIEDVDRAANAALHAAAYLAASSGKDRGRLLRAIAAGIDSVAALLIERAHLETALPKPRLTGEVARTSNQLRLFADVVEEGSWVMARIDTADATRTPPKPDVRSMLLPLGPVAVFGASNFPLAFSVAGGDTASALAGGNPVIFKAHPAHPGTSEIVGHVMNGAIKSSGFPAGIFSLLFDKGHDIGASLVQHPAIRAVGFTGSFRGGRALMRLASERPDPVPVYAEMGSINPVFILPGALKERSSLLAAGLHSSFTLGGGQFCTKPGVVFTEASFDVNFTQSLRSATQSSPAFSLLTGGIASAYKNSQSQRADLETAIGASSSEGYSAQAVLLESTGRDFLARPMLAQEVFGPTTLLIHCDGRDQLLEAAHSLEGHLTATILGTDEDIQENVELLRIIETKVGRIIFNGFPTGVEVCHAMVHGGPYPATSDGRSTSVGTLAILRFTRPFAYQGLPDAVLPAALKNANPLGILRLQNGAWATKSEMDS